MMTDQPDKIQELPEAYQLILSKAEDISQMTIIPFRDRPDLELVPRLHGWKPIQAARLISAAEKRKAKDCPLCQADEKQLSAVWHAYGVSKDVEAAVKAAHDSSLSDVSAKIVKRHFPNHNYDQPAPAKRLSREEMLQLTGSLSERGQRVLIAVYRQRALSTRQIVQLFMESETSSDESAKKTAYRLLHELRFKHLIYPFRVENRKSPEVFYALGKWAVPFVTEHEGRLTGEASVTRRDQVKEYQLEHDINAADMFVQLRSQLYTNRNKEGLVEVEGRKMSLHLPAECWWGSRSLMMGYRTAEGEKTIVPDGFAALQFNDGRKRQFQLPFFLEWDSGYKTNEDTAEQLVNYVLFSRGGSIGLRFPQLKVEGYKVPVLMVTSTPARAQKLASLVREKMAARGLTYEDAPLLLISDAETVSNSGWTAGVWREVLLEEPSGLGLAEQLLAGNQTLIDSAPIHWRLPVQIDLDGAVPASSKMPSFLR